MPLLLALLPTLSLGQWLTIAELIGTAIKDAQLIYAAAHPALAVLVNELKNNATAQEAAASAKSWMAQNADKAIELQPGIGSES